MSVWQRYEDLILEYMENRITELLDQGDISSPKLIAKVRADAAWAADRAVSRFAAANTVQNPLEKYVDD